MISVKAKLKYPPIELPYTYVPYFDPDIDPDDKWENECYRKANCWLKDLFNIEGFTDFFVSNKCCVSIRKAKSFIKRKGGDIRLIDFIHSEEFDRVTDHLEYYVVADRGSIYAIGGLLRDLRYRSTVSVNINGTEVCPFDWEKRRGYVCLDYMMEDLCKCEMALHICRAAEGIIPDLFDLADEMGSDWMCEKGEILELDYPGIARVVDYFIDEGFIPIYNITYPQNTDEGRHMDYDLMAIYRREDLGAQLKKHRRKIQRMFDL